MTIPGLSMQMSHAKVSTGLNVIMLAKAKEQMETTGDDLMRMLESASVGSTGKLDVSV